VAKHRLRIIPKGPAIIAPPFAVGAPDTSRQMCAEVTVQPKLSVTIAKASLNIATVSQTIPLIFDVAPIFLNSFYFEGNQLSKFTIGKTFTISGSEGYDGTYKVVSKYYTSGLNRTRIKVQESIPLRSVDTLNLIDCDFSPFRIWKLPHFIYNQQMYCEVAGTGSLTHILTRFTCQN